MKSTCARISPDAFLGRVTGVSTVGVFGGTVLGTPIGGLPAHELGITASVWFGVIGAALLVTILSRQFDHMTHSGDVARAS